MELEISPEPDEAERKAIVAALEAAAGERSAHSPWAQALPPQREEPDEPQP
jgi:hypothetical protein